MALRRPGRSSRRSLANCGLTNFARDPSECQHLAPRPRGFSDRRAAAAPSASSGSSRATASRGSAHFREFLIRRVGAIRAGGGEYARLAQRHLGRYRTAGARSGHPGISADMTRCHTGISTWPLRLRSRDDAEPPSGSDRSHYGLHSTWGAAKSARHLCRGDTRGERRCFTIYQRGSPNGECATADAYRSR